MSAVGTIWSPKSSHEASHRMIVRPLDSQIMTASWLRQITTQHKFRPFSSSSFSFRHTHQRVWNTLCSSEAMHPQKQTNKTSKTNKQKRGNRCSSRSLPYRSYVALCLLLHPSQWWHLWVIIIASITIVISRCECTIYWKKKLNSSQTFKTHLSKVSYDAGSCRNITIVIVVHLIVPVESKIQSHAWYSIT